MSKPYLEGGVLWFPVSHLARQLNKSRMTVWRWLANGFLLQLGYCIRRDFSGRWFVGKRIR